MRAAGRAPKRRRGRVKCGCSRHRMPRRTGRYYIRLLFALSRHISPYLRHGPNAPPVLPAYFPRPIPFLYSSRSGENALAADVGILIIDDDVDSQRALRQVLDSEGWRVQIVPLASQALAELSKGEWTLILVNVALTDLSGALFNTLRDLAQAEANAGDLSRKRV